jgi:hypothetical protein
MKFNLNSVLIEGKLDTDPSKLSDGSVCFSIESFHNRGTIENPIPESFFFSIRVLNPAVKTHCLEHLKENSKVRIVGRLETIFDATYVIAEYIERSKKEKP